MLERWGLYVAVQKWLYVGGYTSWFKSFSVGDRGVSFLAFRRGLHWSVVG